jgi:cell division protein FtsA
MAEIFNLARAEIDSVLGPVELIAAGVVITGGTALMRGVSELARERFKLPVRIGKPGNVSGLADVVSSPTHATSVGLVRYGIENFTGRGATTSNQQHYNAVPVGVSTSGAHMTQSETSSGSNYASEEEGFESEQGEAIVRKPSGPSFLERIRAFFKDFF